MTLRGETLATGAPKTCPECKQRVEIQVCMSAAGYYIGGMCGCGPYSRETGYFKTRADAELILAGGEFNCRTCGGGGEVHWNPSRTGDPQCEESATCPECFGEGVAP